MVPPEDILPAVALPPVPQQTAEAQFAREKQAFRAMHTELLQRYEGQYVAVYKGKVIDCDQDKGALALRVYRTYGYVPIFVHLVSRDEPLTRFIYSPHVPLLR